MKDMEAFTQQARCNIGETSDPVPDKHRAEGCRIVRKPCTLVDQSFGCVEREVEKVTEARVAAEGSRYHAWESGQCHIVM